MSGAKACALLARHGFTKVRQSGSHVIMQRKVLGETWTAVVPNHREIRPGTLRSIIEQSGLDRAFFEVDR
jgi:predicted RNA binding protein YcfA (HicA-like mRNA interferase family)